MKRYWKLCKMRFKAVVRVLLSEKYIVITEDRSVNHKGMLIRMSTKEAQQKAFMLLQYCAQDFEQKEAVDFVNEMINQSSL